MENKRKDFYSSEEFNLKRANENLITLIENCTFEEIMWIVRNITYDQISYYAPDSKGRIFNGKYSELQIEQATRFQRNISTFIDLFGQVLIDGRVFEEEYIKKYDLAEHYINKIDKMSVYMDELEYDLNKKDS